jgi:hypothetical protein
VGVFRERRARENHRNVAIADWRLLSATKGHILTAKFAKGREGREENLRCTRICAPTLICDRDDRQRKSSFEEVLNSGQNFCRGF